MKPYEQPKDSRITAGFYRDIDALRLRSSCSVFSVLLVLFVLLLIVVGIIAIVLVKGGLAVPGFTTRLHLPSISKQTPATQTFPAVIEGNRATIRLSESDAAALIGVSRPGFPLRDASLKIVPDKIIISGKASDSILAVKADLWFLPKINGSKIDLELIDVRSGNVAAPKYLADTIKSKVKVSIDTPSQNGVVLKEIQLYQGYLELIGETNIPK